MPRTYKSTSEIQLALEEHGHDETMSKESEVAQVEEMMVLGCLAVPREKTLRQRGKYFQGVRFRGLEELLSDAEGVEFI